LETQQYPKIYLYKRIVQAKCFIDKHYPDKIDVGNIADEAFFSKFHFIRLFKKVYGKTPHQYLTSVRIANAILLFEKNTAVGEVCFLVGFESLSSFSALFKKATGLAPALYVRTQQIRKKEIANQPLHYVPGCFAHKLGWSKNSNYEEGAYR